MHINQCNKKVTNDKEYCVDFHKKFMPNAHIHNNLQRNFDCGSQQMFIFKTTYKTTCKTIKQFLFLLQANLVIRGFNIREFAYPRSAKVYQNSVFAEFCHCLLRYYAILFKDFN